MEYKPIKVSILNYNPKSEHLCAIAAKTCQSKNIPEDVDNPERLLDIVVSSGHYSILEHASITYGLEGVSRALTHQLVRHRVASYSQQSQRHVKPQSMREPPKTIRNSPEALKAYEDSSRICIDTYDKLMTLGIPEEDARDVMQNRSTTNITVTMNYREITDSFLPQRMCERAQSEIRDVSYALLGGCKLIAPNIFKEAGTRCLKNMCTEVKKTPNCNGALKKISLLNEIVDSYRKEFDELESGKWLKIDYEPLQFDYSLDFYIKKI